MTTASSGTLFCGILLLKPQDTLPNFSQERFELRDVNTVMCMSSMFVSLVLKTICCQFGQRYQLGKIEPVDAQAKFLFSEIRLQRIHH